MNDTFTDHRTPEELAASYPRMTMWTSETETALRLNVIKPALVTLGGKV